MKFDIMKWQEVQPNETYEAPKGRLHIMCSKESAVYVQAHGVEVLAGVGTEIDVNISEELTYIVEAPKGARIFVEAPRSVWHQANTERFTNDDRRPLESEHVLEVKRALRQMQIEQAQIRAEMRAEAHSLGLLKKRKTFKPEPESVPESEEAEKDVEAPATLTE